jgi:hypothetical protein
MGHLKLFSFKSYSLGYRGVERLAIKNKNMLGGNLL